MTTKFGMSLGLGLTRLRHDGEVRAPTLSPPSLVSSPTISGIGYAGQTITVESDAVFRGADSIEQRWVIDGTHRPELSGISITVPDDASGTRIEYRPIATNASGSVEAASNVVSNWAPNDAPAIHVWLDGADTTSMTLSGDNISRWRDKSGNGLDAAQSSASFRPELVTSSALPLLKSVQNTNTEFFEISSGIQAVNMNVIVARIVNIAGRSSDFGGYTVDKRQRAYPLIADPSSTSSGITAATSSFSLYQNGIQFSLRGASRHAVANAFFNVGQRDIVRYAFSAAPGRYDIIRLFQSINSGWSTEGEWHEVIILNNLIDDSAQRAEGYLSHKWGIPLDAAHPYASVPPPLSASRSQLETDIGDGLVTELDDLIVTDE